jgi:hypothetical protein
MNIHRVSTSGFGVQGLEPGAVQHGIKVLKDVMRMLPQVTIEPTHVFAEGLYARGIMIPKGTILTGKVHKQDDLQIMVSGDILVKTEAGEKRLQGFNMFASKAGYQQIGRALEDTLWVTVHATEETDLGRLEELLYEDEPSMLDFKTGQPIVNVMEAWHDFDLMLHELGVTVDQVRRQSEDPSDQILVELRGVRIGPSAVHGQGVITELGFAAGDHVGPARVGRYRTQLGRFTNHHPRPNCLMQWVGQDIWLVVQEDIGPHRELFVDYRQSVKLVKGGA